MMKRIFKNNSLRNNRGQSLVEVLTAIGVFTVGVLTVAFVIFGAFSSFDQSLESVQSTYLAEEGISAVASIRDLDFDEIEAGTYRLNLTGGAWVLQSGVESIDEFSRIIQITDVEDKIRKVESIVYWDTNLGNTNTTTLTTYLSDFAQTHGDSEFLDADISGISLSSSSTILSGIVLDNSGSEDIEVTDIILEWDTSSKLYEVIWNGETVFSVSTSSGLISGETVDITDKTISEETAAISISWDGSVGGSNFTFTAKLSDNTLRHVFIEM